MAFLEFLLAAAWAWIVAANVLQRITHRLMAVVAVRPVDMAVVMIVVMMIVIAVGTMYVRFLTHLVLLRNKVARDYLAIV